MTIPVTIIAGYLGAGKTTLINQLLQQHDPRGLAIMVNDFGTINVDAELLRESSDGRVRSFANGCICCSIGEDFGTALEALRQQPDPVERVVVEASGVATPANLRRQSRTPGFHPHGCLVVVDAENHQRKVDDKYVGALLRQQIREADWLYVNRNGADRKLGDASQPTLSESEVLSLVWPEPQPAPDVCEPSTRPDFISVSARQCTPIDKRTLTRLLSHLPDWVERVKGFVQISEATLLVQQAGKRFEITPLDTPTEPALVFIAPHAHAETLRSLVSTDWTAWQLDLP